MKLRRLWSMKFPKGEGVVQVKEDKIVFNDFLLNMHETTLWYTPSSVDIWIVSDDDVLLTSVKLGSIYNIKEISLWRLNNKYLEFHIKQEMKIK